MQRQLLISNYDKERDRKHNQAPALGRLILPDTRKKENRIRVSARLPYADSSTTTFDAALVKTFLLSVPSSMRDNELNSISFVTMMNVCA